MGSENGNGRILTVADGRKARPFTLTNAQRAEVQQIAHEIVMEECAKVHEHYLVQLPQFVANMIADALVDRKLIPEFRGIATPEAPAVPESAGGDTPAPDSIEAAEGPSGLIPPAA